MADFELAVDKTIKNEGGDAYTETEGDHGGATKYGISSKFYLEILRKSNIRCETSVELYSLIKNITLQEAKTIYKKYFWDDNRYGEIEDQAIAEKVFDMAVLMGAPQANKIAQSVFNKDLVKIDGIIGNKTIYWINTCEDCIDVFIMNCIRHFISICNKDKSQSKFLFGWLNRVMS